MDALVHLSEELKQTINTAQSIAKEFQQNTYSGAHLLKVILSSDTELVELLKRMGKDVNYLLEWAEVRIESLPKSSVMSEDPPGDDRIELLLEEADLLRIKFSRSETDAICLFGALCKPNVAFTPDQLKSFIVSSKEFTEFVVGETTIKDSVIGSGPQKSDISKPPIKALHKFCMDKTSLAREGKVDPIIGRDEESRIVIEILGRRTKPNVLIIGEPGVGKTALIDGLCNDIIAEKVPKDLINAILFELDLGALAAGASYKGEMEDRMKSIIREIKSFERAILFIDEIHSLFDTSGSLGSGIVNLLKPELTKGEITVVGATTSEEYRELIEPEEAFSRRFEVLRIEEPPVDTAYRMIQHVIPVYVKHHQIDLSDDALHEAVYLAKRYLKERRLPDSAIDLIDRTMASIKLMDEVTGSVLKELSESYADLKKEKDLSMMDLVWFHKRLKSKISPILLGLLEARSDEFEEIPEYIEYLDHTLETLKSLAGKKKGRVEKTDIAALVASKTGIPIGKIQTSEKERLLKIGEHLRSRVIGQDHAIHVLEESILESRAGLTKHNQPIGSFFFLGPTGTGKTELAKTLTEFLFNDESALIRFDMSEFKEEHSAALLYGAPPGYVGYKEGGLLVTKVREKPYSVFLFDEIEKAHPSVFDVFLQIIDEGKLHDRLGREGDFTNSIILFTSNIGSQNIIERFKEAQLPSSDELLEVMSDYFRPEFLGRITEIVPFAPITEENITAIFNIQLSKLVEMLDKKGISLELSKDALDNLAHLGFSEKYGARPLSGIIRNYLRRPISRMIIGGELKKGDVLKISLGKDNELVWNTKTS
jgi:ATP-dependent Clp protease ATP-binding subunit ClpA